MNNIENILRTTSHRPFPLHSGQWKYYQEWHDVLFAHWKVPVKQIEELLPSGLKPDLFRGEAWISMTAFTIKGLRYYLFPSFPALSDFLEIDMRTYVIRNGKPGIYFLSLESHKKGSTLMARMSTGLNYINSVIRHEPDYYESENPQKKFYLRVRYKPGEFITDKTDLDKWLIERYSLFHELSGNIFCNDIHHYAWPLKKVEIDTLYLRYRYGNIIIDRKADLYHYSPGVNVLTWGKTAC